MSIAWVLALFLVVAWRPFLFNASDSTVNKYKQGSNTDEKSAADFLVSYNQEATRHCKEVRIADWNYGTNLIHDESILIKKRLQQAAYLRKAWEYTTSFAWKNFSDPQMMRQFKLMSVLGTAALPDDKLSRYQQLSTGMQSIYGSARICEYSNLENQCSPSDKKNCNLNLEPDLANIMASVEDYDKLEYYWIQWRDASGKQIRETYEEFVDLSNEMSSLNGFKDTADYWLSKYEDDDIEIEFERLWKQVKPLYEQIHAYIRRKLIEIFGKDRIKANGPIPAHILGTMWAQSWENLYDFSAPYPDKQTVDVTDAMVEQNYTPLKVFQMADDFFTSLGLTPMPQEFWNNSIIEKPTDREMVCHAFATDFCDGKDFRIKQCSENTMTSMEVVHHQMGHVQYYLQYKDQPLNFREGANPGFHEAIGDLIALSVTTPKHLTQVGLMEDDELDYETDINFLFRRAIYRVAFIPSAYLIDKWRWDVFRGKVSSDQWNKHWWDLRLKYQGVIPPVPRSEYDFDPGAKYHIPANIEYTRYFVAAILQFQFHKVLCGLAHHEGPLHRCDIYKSKEAGERLRETMERGSSKPWQEVLSVMTGHQTSRMDAAPLMEYFQQLYEWLKQANQNEIVGWTT